MVLGRPDGNAAAQPVWAGPSETFENLGLVAGCPQEDDEVRAGDRGRAVVDERMMVEHRMTHQRLVEHHRDPAVSIIDGAKRRHGPGQDAPDLRQNLGRSERNLARRTDDLMDPLEVDARILLGDDEEKRALSVLEEQVLGVPADNLAAQGLGILHREQRRMSDRRHRDAEIGQRGEEVLGRRRPRLGQRA